jgi:glycosyltransferase involved in cell wall biosynthesis
VTSAGAETAAPAAGAPPRRRSRLRRSPLLFLAWTRIAARSEEIAAALGGEARCLYELPFLDPRRVALRYALSTVLTVYHLIARRPRAVIATDPPIFPGLIAYLYGRLFRAPVVLDSHPSAFGIDGQSRIAVRTMPLQRYLIPRVRGIMVTEEKLAARVRGEGGTAAIVHEAQPDRGLPPAPPLGDRPEVLLVGIFAPDEPVHLLVEAASQLPSVRFRVTGDLRKCPPRLREIAPPNLEFVGYLDQKGYFEAIARANVVVSLTERPEDVSRVACEAVSARRPLIVSDFPAARRYFPHAIAVENTVEGVAAGVARAVEGYEDLVAVADRARAEQEQRWLSQLATLRSLVGAGG